MQKNTAILIMLIMLVVGAGAGYTLGKDTKGAPLPEQQQQGHMMPDGSMMDVMNAELMGKTGDAFDQAFLA